MGKWMSSVDLRAWVYMYSVKNTLQKLLQKSVLLPVKYNCYEIILTSIEAHEHYLSCGMYSHMFLGLVPTI